eukprot:2891574-Prymnesium_polylepis.1
MRTSTCVLRKLTAHQIWNGRHWNGRLERPNPDRLAVELSEVVRLQIARSAIPAMSHVGRL